MKWLKKIYRQWTYQHSVAHLTLQKKLAALVYEGDLDKTDKYLRKLSAKDKASSFGRSHYDQSDMTRFMYQLKSEAMLWVLVKNGFDLDCRYNPSSVSDMGGGNTNELGRSNITSVNYGENNVGLAQIERRLNSGDMIQKELKSTKPSYLSRLSLFMRAQTAYENGIVPIEPQNDFVREPNTPYHLPTYYAIATRHHKLLQSLLWLGAPTHKTQHKDNSASVLEQLITNYCERSYVSQEDTKECIKTLEILRLRGVDLLGKFTFEENALIRLSFNYAPTIEESGLPDTGLLQFFLDQGGDINQEYVDVMSKDKVITAFNSACLHQNDVVVDFYLQYPDFQTVEQMRRFSQQLSKTDGLIKPLYHQKIAEQIIIIEKKELDKSVGKVISKVLNDVLDKVEPDSHSVGDIKSLNQIIEAKVVNNKGGAIDNVGNVESVEGVDSTRKNKFKI